ncbi:MAG: acyl-CoA thioesterase [Rubricella sp.]
MKAPRPTREQYRHFTLLPTRWRDNDVYGHMNNAVFYEYVDTAVNGWLASSGALEVPGGAVVGLVVHSECHFFASLGFPRPVSAGLRAERIGKTSVTYAVGLFDGEGESEAAAMAAFTHVYVDAGSRRPIPLPAAFRAALAEIV